MAEQSKQAKILEKVRALLAKADSTKFEAEADTFRAKADELMTRYAIESWQVGMAEEGSLGSRDADLREYPIGWFTSRNPAYEGLWALFSYTTAHCRVQIVYEKSGYAEIDGKRQRTIPLVGMPADLEYFDMLFTSLMLQLSKKIDPRPSPERSYEENLAALKDAGMNWDEISSRMIRLAPDQVMAAGHIKEPGETESYQGREKVRDRMLRHYRRWCRKTGHEQTYHNWQTFRRSFAEGFAWEVSDRLTDQLRQQEATFSREDGNSDSMALAIRDIRAVVREAVYNYYPELRPHEKDCQCDRCKRARSRKPSRGGGRADTRVDNYDAFKQGRKAGREANLSAPRPQAGKSLPGG